MLNHKWGVAIDLNVLGPGGCRNSISIGLEAFGHPNFQVVLNLSIPDVVMILAGLCGRVEDGERFEAGQMVEDIFTDCKIRLDAHKDGGQDVLRVIIPDKNNLFPEDPDCEQPYTYQTHQMFGEIEGGAPLGLSPIQ